MSSRSVFLCLSLLLLGLAACGGSSRDAREAPVIRTLTEAAAIEIITEVLQEAGIPLGSTWLVSISPETELDVDLRLGSSNFGIEWISPQDREDVGTAVPMPAEGGQLRIVPGTGDDEAAQVLVLEHSAFEYANEREAVQAGVPGAGDAEGRLRRDVRDFLDYVQGQGGL
jgi:hypothetical protein